MKPLEIFLQSLICIFLVANIHISQCQELDELDVLYEYLEELGTDAKVGFLSASNYISVKRKLPANARPVYVAHKEDLTEMVLNGSIVAALTSGLPAQEYHDRLHIFSSTIVTLHSILMAPDESGDFPHGVNEEFSTLDLASAINAAIARVQLKEIDLQIAKKNAPKEIVLAHTCKEDDQTQFQVSNRNSAKGVLRKILDQKVIKVLADGPYNWGDNDGNYLVDPPVGFYPDILDAIIDEFRNLAGPDGEIYGADIRMERISTLASPFPWYFLFNGTAHISEPYFILDAAYGGTGKSCAQQEDCPKANLEGGHENCQWGYCRHPNRPRVMMFRPSCTVLGTDSKFFTKRSVPLSFNTTTTDPDHHSTEATTKKLDTTTSSNTGSIIAIVILSLLVVGLAGGVGFLVFREKRGSPVFKQFY